jgi:hypothetical protein
MYKFLLSILLFSALAASAQTKQALKNRDKYMYTVSTQSTNFVETIPFLGQNNVIIVPVYIDGVSYNFLFDTGAATVISTALKDKLQLQPMMSDKTIDASGKEIVQEFYQMKHVQLGNVTFRNVGTIAFDLSDFSRVLCTKIDGVIGSNLMRGWNWKINYDMKTMTFSDKKIIPEGKYESVPFAENFSGTPLLKIFLRKSNFQMALDTGNNSGFDIPDSIYFKIIKPAKAVLKKGYGNNNYTFYQNKTIATFESLADSISVGDVLLQKQSIDITPAPLALLGNKFFKKFGEIVIDYHNHKLLLPKKEVVCDTYDTYGFEPIFKDRKLLVGFIWENTEAQQLGIAPGDVITSINGKDTTNLSDEDWCELRASLTEQKVIDISLVANGTAISHTFKKFDLLK